MATSTSEYIQHHLQNLTWGRLPAGYVREHADGTSEVLGEATWTLAHGPAEAAAMGFHAVHLDSLAWSALLGMLFCAIFGLAARRVRAGVPGRTCRMRWRCWWSLSRARSRTCSMAAIR